MEARRETVIQIHIVIPNQTGLEESILIQPRFIYLPFAIIKTLFELKFQHGYQ